MDAADSAGLNTHAVNTETIKNREIFMPTSPY